MKKQLFKSMLLLCALIVGSSNVWAGDVVHYTLDGTVTDGGNSNYAQDGGGLTQNGMDWSVTGNTTINPWRIGGKNLTGVDREAYSKTAMGTAITKIELDLGEITLTVNSIKLIVASNSDFSTVIESFTETSITANTTLTFTPTAPATDWATGAYYKFVFNVTAGSSNSYVQLKSAKFYESGYVPTHTATFSVNGETTSTDFSEDADIVFPADPADVNGKKFVGWTATPIVGTTDVKPAFVDAAKMGSSDVTYYAVFADAALITGTFTDDLVLETTGVESGSTYTNWSGKTAADGSDAVYSGNSGGVNSSIQLRSNNSNSGIVSTTTGGTIKKVVVEWNSNTADGRTLDIYGSTTAYTNATDLYNANAGTKLGSVVYGTSTELSITGDYQYIGLRSNNNAMFLDKISIYWEGEATRYSGYCTTVPAPTYDVTMKEGTLDAGNWEINPANAASGTEITLKYNGKKKVKNITIEKAAAGPVTYTALSGGEVLHVGDIIEVPVGQEWYINNSYYLMPDYNPFTVVRANLTGDPEEPTVTEAADGAYYVIKNKDGGWFFTDENTTKLPATGTSDGIYVTYNGIQGGYPSYTFSVHEK